MELNPPGISRDDCSHFSIVSNEWHRIERWQILFDKVPGNGSSH